MFAVIFICGNLFLPIAGKSQKLEPAKISSYTVYQCTIKVLYIAVAIHLTIIERGLRFVFIQNASKFLTTLPPRRHFKNISLFFGTVSGYKQMILLQILLTK